MISGSKVRKYIILMIYDLLFLAAALIWLIACIGQILPLVAPHLGEEVDEVISDAKHYVVEGIEAVGDATKPDVEHTILDFVKGIKFFDGKVECSMILQYLTVTMGLCGTLVFLLGAGYYILYNFCGVCLQEYKS